MRILIISQYFWPEVFIINDLAKALEAEGHSITVATGLPNYPSGAIPEQYAKKKIIVERFGEDIQILRIPILARGKGGAARLSLNYLSFVVSGMLHLPRVLREREFDVVLFFGVSPMTSAIPAAVIAWQKEAHFAVWIQDLWPESLAATGYVQNRFALGIIDWLIRKIYRRADTLLLQSRAFAAVVAAKSDPSKLVYFPNPAPLEAGGCLVLPQQLEEHFGSHFSVVFAGNLGRAQSIDTIVEAARLLRKESKIRFILVGAGSESERLRQLIAKEALQNIVLVGRLDGSMMPAVYRHADVLLVTLRDDIGLSTVIPSKVQAYMQAGKPIVASLSGEGARVIAEAECGVVVKAEDANGLAQSILTLSSMPATSLIAMGDAGRRYFEAHFDVRSAAKQLLQILRFRMERRRDG